MNNPTLQSVWAPLVDRFGRVHNNLRISVTDRCNIRCFYCMPVTEVQFKPREELLTFEEFQRLTRVFVRLGINKLRLTGGEPLVRANLDRLVSQLAALPGVMDLALTTNAILLPDQAEPLRRAGLQRLNISLDGLSEEIFQKITRRTGVQRVIDGIDAAIAAGFERIRLNAVAIRGLTEQEIVPLAQFARQRDLELRFIEFMPLDAEGNWSDAQVLDGAQIRKLLETEFGPLTLMPRPDPSQPAMDFRFADGRGGIGFINPVSQPFCGECNRLRVTSEGQVRNCLFSTEERDVRDLLRGDASDEQIAQLIRESVMAKKIGHGIDTPEFIRPAKAMYQIGG